MITYENLFDVLLTTKMPVAYHHFSKTPSLPYLVFLREDTEMLGADNKNYVKFNNWLVELYTGQKSLEHEKQVEDALDTLEVAYSTVEGYLETEKMYLVRYEFGG